jgi:hypothetical protein
MHHNLRAAAMAVALAAPAALAQNDASTATPVGTRPTSILSDSTFNPAISLILDGKYRDLSQDPETYQIGGFIPAGGHEEGGHAHGAGPGERGFGIDESELTISANIDPYFSGYFTAAVSRENEIEVEEAFIQNSGYVPGTTIKFGRFFSAFGYQNEQHPHVWDFVDLPLAHQAFFGGNLIEDGIQLRYVAPTPVLLEFGVEGGSGSNFPGTERNKNGFGGGGGFVRLGGDVGASSSYRVGASYRKMSALDRIYDDSDTAGGEVENAFSGDSELWGVDLVWKWAPNGDPSVRNFKFQAEYMHREEDGELAYCVNEDPTPCGTPGVVGTAGSYVSKQKGWYAQAVYQFIRRWRAGLRYEQLDSGTTDIGLVTAGLLTPADFPILADNKPKRTSAMVDFSPSEFSRLRLQYSRDQARFDESDNQIFVQYIMSLGSHGAHKF